jgi:4-hydroxy-2-oxoheptanedioate aldolase
MMQRNYLREKLARGCPVLGTWNTLAAGLVTEVLAHAGLDFLLLDFEHGPFELGLVHDYVNRCERYGCSPLVRLPADSDWMVLQALDQGAHGVMVPHVDDAEGARALVAAASYAPRGRRGFTPFTKAGGFTNRQAAAYAARANDFVVSAVLVESRRGLESLDAILAEDGIDVVYFGAYDLSQELGAAGDVRAPRVLEAIRDGVRKVVAAGKCAGGFVAESRDDVKWLLDLGMRFITYEVDAAILARPTAAMVEWFAKETGQ